MERVDLKALRAACLYVDAETHETGAIAQCIEAANHLEDWRPQGYTQAPHGAGSEAMRDGLEQMRRGQQPSGDDVPKMVRAFVEWRETITATEASNAGTLIGLLLLHRDATTLAERHPDDQAIAACRNAFEQRLRREWRVECALPKSRIEAREFAPRHCIAGKVMPREWRGL